MRVLVSQSRDGDLGTFACDRLGYRTVRGSSSRGGVSALRSLARELSTQGGWAALIVDGPRGPRRKSKPGAVWLSEKTGIPITAVCAETQSAWRMRGWDQGVLPVPFASIQLHLSPPGFPKDPGALDAMMEENSRRVRPANLVLEPQQ